MHTTIVQTRTAESLKEKNRISIFLFFSQINEAPVVAYYAILISEAAHVGAAHNAMTFQK
jgi:hypothetical protein